jgi:hypothetical protein
LQALSITDTKIQLVSKKIILNDEQIIKNKAYIKLTESIIEKIKKENC